MRTTAHRATALTVRRYLTVRPWIAAPPFELGRLFSFAKHRDAFVDAGESPTADVATAPLAASFEDWYANECERLIAVVSLAAGDRELGADLVAEATARAWERWGRVGSMANPSGWTYTVAMNLLKRRKWREGVERNLLRREHVPDVPPPGDPGFEIWQAVAELSERQRLMVGLRYVEDMTEPQIAELLGVAPGTVAATLSQARTRLRSTLPNDRSESV